MPDATSTVTSFRLARSVLRRSCTYRCPLRRQPSSPTVQEPSHKSTTQPCGLRDDRLSVHATLLKHARHADRVPPAMVGMFRCASLNSNSRQLQPVTSRQASSGYAAFPRSDSREIRNIQHTACGGC